MGVFWKCAGARMPASGRQAHPTRFSSGMRLVAIVPWIRGHDKDKSSPKSYALVIAVSLVIALLMPFVRALRHGDTNVAAAYRDLAPGPVAATSSLPRGSGADQLSLLVVGVFLLGLGSVLRRVA